MSLAQKVVAEFIGTFWLVFGGLRQRRAGGRIYGGPHRYPPGYRLHRGPPWPSGQPF